MPLAKISKPNGVQPVLDMDNMALSENRVPPNPAVNHIIFPIGHKHRHVDSFWMFPHTSVR